MDIQKFKEEISNLENIKSLDLNIKDEIELNEYYNTAKEYLESYNWVHKTLNCWIGLGVNSIVAVFLFQIKPTKKGIDEYIWVVSGDLPNVYIDIESASGNESLIDIIEVLDCYIYIVSQWVEAVKSNESVSNCYPLGLEPIKENAENLELKLNFIQNEIIPMIKE